MALFIKNDEVERLARTLAARRNISITEAIRQSLAREVGAGHTAMPDDRKQLFDDLMEITERAGMVPNAVGMIDDEILGYDEFGAPTR
jgi:antitoxin VapB